MAKYPGATVRLLPATRLSGKTLKPVRVNLHTQAGTGSLYNFFNQAYRASSHFWVSKTGVVEQYVDTGYAAEADLEGNGSTISIETEGTGEPWTPAQLNAIIHLVAWCVNTHKIPKRLATSSKPDATSHGISWHRLGIDGNFPALPSPYAGRLQRGGGMLYSLSRGKLCPTNNRIDQIPAVLEGVQNLDPTTPVPIPPTPTPSLEYDMDKLDLRNAQNVPVKGRHVNNLQGLLLAAGYGPTGLVGTNGKPDGVGGAKTKEYVGQWQVKTNTGDGKGHADYVVGDGTWKSIIEA